MYECNQSEASAADRPLVPTEPYVPVQNIAEASLLFWGEHCVECAAPACYHTCDLYRPRPDGHCRRFASGIVQNPAFRSARGYGAEISFKRWGKLETRGNTALISYPWLLRLERLLGWSARALDRFGNILSPLVRDERLRSLPRRLTARLGRTLHARARRSAPPDAFLVEVFNPGSTPENLQISMTVARSELPAHARQPTASLPSFRKRLDLPPGYSRHDIPYGELSVVTESGLPFDIALTPEADRNPKLVFISADFVRFAQHRMRQTESTGDRPAIKCVVWDLDNTLWKGILLEEEDGAKVQPKKDALELIRLFDQRGILSSVASKNDFDLALAKIREIGIEEYVLFPQIGWRSKSEGIKAIAEKLNINIDTFLFVDDNQFELEEVAGALPTVTCVNAREISNLRSDPRLQGSTTAESKRRRWMYREAMSREQEERNFGEDFFGFLRSCQISLRIIPYESKYFERVCELLQRTNQLNFSGRKYQRAEVDALLARERLNKWVLECSDKFGSYGVVGFSLTEQRADEIWIEDFMLSCRVQGRFIEQAFFDALVRGDPTIQRIAVNFRATGRNTPAQQVLRTIGFQEANGRTGIQLDLRERNLRCDFINAEVRAIENLRSVTA